MKHLASKLAAQGRYGDTELVHMNKDEVRALQGLGSLFGRQLHTNPTTGLKEAFDFSSLIPAFVGLAVTAGTSNPWLGATAAGVGETARSGDAMRGLMTGLLSGGLGSIAGNMGTPAAAGAEAGAGAVGANTAAQLAATQQGVGGLAGQAGVDSMGVIGNQQLAMEMMQQKAAEEAAKQAAMQTAAQAPAVQTSGGLGDMVAKNMGERYPGWSWENLANMEGAVPTSAKLATGVGALGTANYMQEDAMEASRLADEASVEKERERQRKRYAYYADIANRVNQGFQAPPTGPIFYPGDL